MAADQAVGDRMEGARPWQAHFLLNLADDALRAPRHLDRGAPREGQQQDALGLCSPKNEMRDPVGERVGLAGARAGDDEQRLRARLRGFALPGIEAFEGRRGAHRRDYRPMLYKLPVPRASVGLEMLLPASDSPGLAAPGLRRQAEWLSRRAPHGARRRSRPPCAGIPALLARG